MTTDPRYDKLSDKVTKMLQAQETWFKSKTPQHWAIWKAYEKDVKEIINPTKIKQTTFEWLAR